VITASSGEVVMIDSGPDESLIRKKLRALNISHIDLLIASHPHTDHITGMDSIICTYQPRAFVDIGIPHTTKTYEYLIRAIQKNNVKYYQATERKIRLGPLIFHILPPANPYLENSELNNNSAVIRLDYGKVSFLFPGDIETEYTEYLRKDEKGFEVRCWLVPYKSEQRLDPKEHPSVSLHVSYVAKYVLENGLDVAQVFRQFWGLWNAPIGHLQGIFEFPPSVYIRNVYTRPEIVFKRVGNRFEFSLKDLPPFTYVETRFVMYPAPEIFFSTKNPSLTMKEIKQIEKKYLLFTYYLTENPEVIRKAIEAGADVNAQDTDGRTPLMLAARWNRNPKVIKMLLNAGADKKIKCNNGKKAFDYAKENEFINSTEVYHLLKDTDTPQILSMVAFREMRQAIQDINKPMIRVDELIMKYGNPTYNLRVFISQRKFYRHILVYEVEKEDGTIFFVALTIRSHNNYSPVGKLIDSNVVTVDNLRDLIWPGWGMRLVDCLISETNIQERYNSIERQKEIESVRTRINTSLGDITSDTQAQFFNEQHLFSAQAYKNVSKGKLILAFELNPEIGIMAPGFLVRLFDKNGHFLYHFFTEEMYKTFGLNHEQFQIPMIIVYNVPSMFLRETHYVEMGFSP
jgi:hypothetical protein